MSKISQLTEKPEKVTVGGVEIDLYPFNLNDMDVVASMDSENTNPDAMKKMIRLVLKRGVPDATDEEIDGISLKHMQELVGHIERVNGLSGKSQSADARLRDKMRKVQGAKL